VGEASVGGVSAGRGRADEQGDFDGGSGCVLVGLALARWQLPQGFGGAAPRAVRSGAGQPNIRCT
jgi:hypothetical protein